MTDGVALRRHPGRRGHPVELREQAAAMRRDGVGRASIARQLGIGFSTVARWFREDGVTAEAVLGGRDAWRASHRRTIDERWAHQQAKQDVHRDAVGPLSDRELLLVGAALYAAEGTKSKPWRRSHRVTFVNSDPAMIGVFLAFLDVLGVPRPRLRCHVYIHETADVVNAETYWRSIVGGGAEFGATGLKKHRPSTVRYNRDDTYYGCLAITVRGSGDLYRWMAGTWEGVAEAVSGPLDPPSSSG